MKREGGEKRGEWEVRMRRWELWMRDEKWVGEEWRETSKRGVSAALVMALYAVRVCVVYYKLLYKSVITNLFLFVFVQKVPLECNNSRSLSHTLIPSSTIQHGEKYDQNLCLPHVYFKKGTTIASKGKHTNKTVCRTSGACEEVSGKTSYHSKFCF